MKVLDKIKLTIKEALLWVSCYFQTRGLKKKNPLLIYQMGKVGSSTIYRSLQQQNQYAPIFQIHTLNPQELKKAIKKQRESIHPFLSKHLILSYYLIRIIKRDKNLKITIITLTREPIQRAISFFFEDIKKKAPELFLNKSQISTENVKREILKILRTKNGISDPGIWFNCELKNVFDIDMLTLPYKIGQPLVCEKNGIRVLLLRLEDLDINGFKWISDFLNLPIIIMKESNLSKNKWYKGLIEDVKGSRLPAEYIKKIHSTQYFQKFYSESE